MVEFKIRTIKEQIDTRTTEGKLNSWTNYEILSKIDNNIERMYIKNTEYEISEEAIVLR